jgi:hypothetical protein
MLLHVRSYVYHVYWIMTKISQRVDYDQGVTYHTHDVTSVIIIGLISNFIAVLWNGYNMLPYLEILKEMQQ